MKSSELFFKIVLIGLVIFLSQTRVTAKDEWVQIRSKNFRLFSNAADRDVRRVANRLEQFRETFRRLLPEVNFDSSIPINVIVFKDKPTFQDFKPIDGNGNRKDWVKGYFQSGADVNYIVLSVDTEKANPYRTVYHEYVHFLVSNNLGLSTIPPWFNEGLAEYYETFQIEDDQKVTLGSVNNDAVFLLRQNKLIPFEIFFNTDNYSLLLQGGDGAGLFHAQAWALMHYLMRGNDGARSPQLNKFLDLVLKGKKPKEAFTEAFGIDYAAMESELKEYIGRQKFSPDETNFKDKISYVSEMQSSPVSNSEAKAVLGDLLYHTNRLPEAIVMLEESLTLDANSSLANASLGLVKLRQNKFTEAKKYLEKAVALDDKNYLTHYQYAFALSREGMTDFGFVSDYSGEQAAQMRRSLEKAIALNPNFAESYNLYALVNIVRNEEIDQARVYLDKALKLAPGNQWFQIRSAEVYLRKEDFPNARKIAQKIYETAPDDRLRVYAKTTLSTINSFEAQLDSIKNKRPPMPTDVTDKPLTDEEMARLNEKAMRESINYNLRRLKANEKRVLGYLSKIECRTDRVDYSIKVDNETFKLSSENFDSLKLITYDATQSDGQIGCEPLKKEAFAVITYRPTANVNAKSAGEIIAIEFVPKNFIFLY